MKKQLLTILGMMIATLSVLANNGENTLTVVVKNVMNTDGVIRVTLFDEESNWLKNGIIQKVSIEDKNAVIVVFDDVPSGTYAVSVMHDENGNNTLDKNAFGIPSEPYGFSNNVESMFGPASYEESKFEIQANKTVQITIK